MQAKLQLNNGHYRTSYYSEGQLVLGATASSYIRHFGLVTLPAFLAKLPAALDALPGRVIRHLTREQAITAVVLGVMVVIAIVNRIAS